MNHNLKVDPNTETVKAVAVAVNHAINVLGFDGLLATSLFPSAAGRRVMKLAA